MHYRVIAAFLAVLVVTGFYAVQTSLVLAQQAETTTETVDEKKAKAKGSFRAQNDVLYYGDDTCSSSPAAAATPGAGSDCKGEPLPDSIPEYWRNLIDNAAAKYPDTDRRLVAATLWIENRGWPDPNKNWATSSAGASGPWQFIPSSWSSMGVDCNGDGKKNVNDPADAVCAAFVHMKGSACKPILEGATGDADGDYANTVFKRDGNNTLMSALANYNGSGTRDGVPLSQQGRGQNPDYVRMGYWLIVSDFTQTVDLDNGSDQRKNIDPSTAGGAASGSGSADAGAVVGSCTGSSGSDGSVVNIGGGKYAFPIVLPKNDVTNGTAWPCPGICHHDGTPAFDLSKNAQDDSTTGTSVVAITDGKIERLNNSYSGIDGCQSFQLVGTDGYHYWYGHIQSASVQDGATVAAGQQIAVVGRRDCTGNGSYPHLHIDRGSKGTAGGSVGNRDSGMVPLINELYEKIGSNL